MCGQHRFHSRVFFYWHLHLFFSNPRSWCFLQTIMEPSPWVSVYCMCDMPWHGLLFGQIRKKRALAPREKRNPSQLCPTCGVVWCDVCPAISPCRWHSHLRKEKKRKECALPLHPWPFILSLASPLFCFLVYVWTRSLRHMRTGNCWNLGKVRAVLTSHYTPTHTTTHSRWGEEKVDERKHGLLTFVSGRPWKHEGFV